MEGLYVQLWVCQFAESYAFPRVSVGTRRKARSPTAAFGDDNKRNICVHLRSFAFSVSLAFSFSLIQPEQALA
jgi:hypothetical protein